jgi:hypothetical protein
VQKSTTNAHKNHKPHENDENATEQQANEQPEGEVGQGAGASDALCAWARPALALVYSRASTKQTAERNKEGMQNETVWEDNQIMY